MDFSRINRTNRISRRAVLWAALEVAGVLLGAGSGCAHPDSYGDFFIAVRNDKVDVLRDLLQRGFDPNTRDPSGQLGLILAFQEDSPKAARLLMAQPGVDLNALNAAGESALMLAALKGDMAAINALIEHGARVNQPGWSALHYAATGPQVQAVRVLLDRGADINAAAPNGNTPLMMATQYGPQESVELLLERGADRARRNARNLQAADIASQVGREALVRKLTPTDR